MSEDETKEICYEGKFKRFVIRDGWEYIERVDICGIVSVLALTEKREVLLIDQLRIPVNKQVIEFPSGLAGDGAENRGEDLVEAAKRELFEETGFEAENWKLLIVGPSSPASMSDMIHVFRAEKLRRTGKGGGDETEDIHTHLVPLAQVHEWFSERQKEGYLVDPKVYAGLYLLLKDEGLI